MATTRSAVRRIIRGSTPFQERLTTGWEDEAAALAAVIAETAGAADDDLIPWWSAARSCGPTARSSASPTALFAGEDREQLAARLRALLDRPTSHAPFSA